MKRTLYIAGGFTLAFLMPFNLQAQNTQPKDTTMNRTVVVEQEYNPDILDASKVNVLPKVEEPTVSKKEVEYATTFFPATSIPADLMRPYVKSCSATIAPVIPFEDDTLEYLLNVLFTFTCAISAITHDIIIRMYIGS